MPFKTRDLITASILIASKIKLKDIEIKKDTFYFIFDKSKELNDILDKFSKGTLEVNASDLFTSFKKLKSMIELKLNAADNTENS